MGPENWDPGPLGGTQDLVPLKWDPGLRIPIWSSGTRDPGLYRWDPGSWIPKIPSWTLMYNLLARKCECLLENWKQFKAAKNKEDLLLSNNCPMNRFLKFCALSFCWILFCVCTLKFYYLHRNKRNLKFNPVKVKLHDIIYLSLCETFFYFKIFITQKLFQ